MEQADLILYNARVLLSAPRSPRAELVAVRDGRIAWVGSNDDRELWQARRDAQDENGVTLWRLEPSRVYKPFYAILLIIFLKTSNFITPNLLLFNHSSFARDP